jgi:hypothetical protein
LFNTKMTQRDDASAADDLDCVDDLIDDTVTFDPLSILPQPSPHAAASLSGAAQAACTCSIVYHDTWLCPVLYLSSMPPVPREVIMSTLVKSANGAGEESIGQEMHPVTGLPSYFLHPCMTNDVIKLLVGGGSSIGVGGSDGGLRGRASGLFAFISVVNGVVDVGFRADVFKECMGALKE